MYSHARITIALAALLAFPATAAAEPFGELPFTSVKGVATCVRSTGVPGEIVRWTSKGAQVLKVDAAGFGPVSDVALGHATSCPQVAGQPNGALVIAAVVSKGERNRVRVVLRAPGGRLRAPITIPLTRDAFMSEYKLAAAITPAGDAVIGVIQTGPIQGWGRVLALRPAGGPGVPLVQQVTPRDASTDSDETVLAAADAAGRLTLAYRRGWGDRSRTEAVTAAPGGRFGAPQRVAPIGDSSDPALAVAPDGRALLAQAGPTGITVAEREPGADRFGPPTLVDTQFDPESTVVSASIVDGGAAVVGSRSPVTADAGMRIVTRATVGAFGPVQEVPAPYVKLGRFWRPGTNDTFYGRAADHAAPTIAIDGAGFLLTWTDERATGATVVTGQLGGATTTELLGGTIRPIASLAPIRIVDGRLAVIWTDNEFTGPVMYPSGKGRLHLALPGAPDVATTPPPRIVVPRLKRQTVGDRERVAVPVRCSGPCDVRATLRGARSDTFTVRSFDRAATLQLELVPGTYVPVARPRLLKVDLRISAPGSRVTTLRRIRVPVKLLPPSTYVQAVADGGR